MYTEEIIGLTVGQEKLSGYSAYPDGDGPFPGVVIIHEIFGLNENIKDIAHRFAEAGYAAFAIDLFAGRNRAICMSRFMAQMLTSPLNNSSIRTLKQALTYLGEQPRVDANRIGAIGFCMGGGFAIAWATSDNRLKTIAPFYGANPRPLEAVSRSCPVVGSYPAADFTAKQATKLDEALTTYNIEHDIKIYPGAKHSFFNDQGKSYDAAASKDAWERVLAYFQKHLG
ncbi:carboxymethylenebutenolidase [Dictyobacter alpinus]|uniref:Carboxymethylenebutenolidase n=1 Tax=Dictyobacter alpinus TaxID=2014873 RepID=A0A402BJ39_9CHLR|nr:dienelactone hydrolase family protein [Dictyobacter alpinus]GCE31408.1 carboxymethylenebutenolidase [Dictyobacter alpinus]